ncbi:MAG TPA: BREX-6 system BrxE protein [Verrucomicrobiota bacterium]|nr:BREX-6 system BrxE protein [Verrucomicrobiota bacterium]
MMADLTTTFESLGIALGLGLLVGMQRERAASRLAGFRTFPLVTLLGVLCAELGRTRGGWLIAAGFLALAGLIVASNHMRLSTPEADPGLTTEAALLVMFGVGAYLVGGHRSVAVAVGGVVAILLHLKQELHALARRIDERLRQQLSDPDRLRTLYFLGFEHDEHLAERLAALKKSGVPPARALGLSIEGRLDRDQLAATLTRGVDGAHTVVPGGRQLKGAVPEAPEVLAARLAAALVPWFDSYPLPYARVRG